jgi:hypothetical protein
MSDNFFDENIKKKLESIQPEYSEAAWKKLKRAMPLPWYVSLLKEYGGWIFGGVASMALLTNYFSNQNYKKENLILNDKISTLNSQIVEKTFTKTDTVYVSKFDTVYLTEVKVKEVVKYVSVQSNPGLVDKLPTNSSTKNTPKDSKVLAQNQNINESKDLSGIKNLPDSKETILEDANVDNESMVLKDPQVVAKQNVEEKVANNQEVKPETQDPLKEESVAEKPKAVPLIDELVIPDTKKPEPKESSKFQDFLKNLNPRFGITADMMGKFSNSFGPNIEILQGERFGLNIGLLIGSGDRKSFNLPNDFNRGTGKQFEKRYEKYFNEKPVRIEDIRIESSSIQLPLFVNYYIPLNYKLGFMLSTGTKLNLNWVEKVSYTGRTQSGFSYYDKFERPFKPDLFNNLFYGMGVQYQRRRFIGQVLPYFEFPFRQGDYLTPPKRFGVNASIKFSLKK